MSVLVDTGILIDYLRGERRVARAVDAHPHRAISALTWLEAMSQAPPRQHETTLAFLRSFERLSISESIADEALRLRQAHSALDLHRALNWATARANRLVFVSDLPEELTVTEADVVLPYRRSRAG